MPLFDVLIALDELRDAVGGQFEPTTGRLPAAPRHAWEAPDDDVIAERCGSRDDRWLQTAALFLQREDGKRAEFCLLHYRDCDPERYANSSTYLANMGQALALQQRHAEAESFLRNGIEREPDNLGLRLRHVEMMEALERPAAELLPFLHDAHLLAPDDEELRDKYEDLKQRAST